jgi:hypothetical protein
LSSIKYSCEMMNYPGQAARENVAHGILAATGEGKRRVPADSSAPGRFLARAFTPARPDFAVRPLGKVSRSIHRYGIKLPDGKLPGFRIFR